MLLYSDRLKSIILGTIMQDKLANTYYIIICVESPCDQNRWLDHTLVPKFSLCDLKNFLEEDPSSHLDLETPFQVQLLLYHPVPKQFVSGS